MGGGAFCLRLDGRERQRTLASSDAPSMDADGEPHSS
jgi:hypothetical protein